MILKRRRKAIPQRGAALLVLMLVLFLGATTWFLSQSSPAQWRNQSNRLTDESLALAKSALIGRAAADNNRPGSLPCPDIDNDGKADGDFGFCSKNIGRLPWRTLNLPDLLDGNRDRLWYRLTDELQDNEDAPPINSTLSLGLVVDGTANIAAIVFSPGVPLLGQGGRPSDNITDYLDGTNQSGPYISGPAATDFNDRLLFISRNQLFSVVNRRIQNVYARKLEEYRVANAGLYPENGTNLQDALSFDTDTTKLLNDNNWNNVIEYETSADRKQLTLKAPPAPSCTIKETHPLCT